MRHIPKIEIKYKTYKGQLNRLFGFCNLPPILGITLVYPKKIHKPINLCYKLKVFKFICKHVLRLNPEYIAMFTDEQSAKAAYEIYKNQFEKASVKLDAAIDKAFREQFMNVDNLPKVDFDIVPSEIDGVSYLKSNE